MTEMDSTAQGLRWVSASFQGTGTNFTFPRRDTKQLAQPMKVDSDHTKA